MGSVADNKEKYQINREVCSVPGFLMLDKLLPKHIDIPEIYHLVIALLLGHPVSGKDIIHLFTGRHCESV